jgi:ferredoxin
MVNSTDSVINFIENLDLAEIYVEDNFPLPVTSTIKMQAQTAASMLIGSAMVGNKVVGFFHKVPPFEANRPLRAFCVFFASQLPDCINVPLFFCKTPSQLVELLPRAVKTSTDTGMPVQVIISANALNNYTHKAIPYEIQDKSQPYFSDNILTWKPSQKEDKVKAAHAYLTQAMPPKQGEANISLKLNEAWFPEYIMPMSHSQSGQLQGLTKIKTTPEELSFVSTWLCGLLGLRVEITADLEPEPALVTTELCPGCPFMAIFACKDIVTYKVFTSVNCRAIREIYGVHYATYAEMRGMLSKKLNVQPLFVSMASQAPDVKPSELVNGTVILLQDNNDAPKLPFIKAMEKLKSIKNCALPYGCTNIKKASLPKFNIKKCNCISSATEPICKQSTHCPALYEGETAIKINKTLCSGCRVCTGYCPTKALS